VQGATSIHYTDTPGQEVWLTETDFSEANLTRQNFLSRKLVRFTDFDITFCVLYCIDAPPFLEHLG
jgi:hypothetical protein